MLPLSGMGRVFFFWNSLSSILYDHLRIFLPSRMILLYLQFGFYRGPLYTTRVSHVLRYAVSTISVLLEFCCHSRQNILLNLLLTIRWLLGTNQMHHYKISQLPLSGMRRQSVFSLELCPASCMTISKRLAIQDNIIVFAICILQRPFINSPCFTCL